MAKRVSCSISRAPYTVRKLLDEAVMDAGERRTSVRRTAILFPVEIAFDNDSVERFTVLQIDARTRPLFVRIYQALAIEKI
jgi:hypothetical protein